MGWWCCGYWKHRGHVVAGRECMIPSRTESSWVWHLAVRQTTEGDEADTFIEEMRIHSRIRWTRFLGAVIVRASSIQLHATLTPLLTVQFDAFHLYSRHKSITTRLAMYHLSVQLSSSVNRRKENALLIRQISQLGILFFTPSPLLPFPFPPGSFPPFPPPPLDLSEPIGSARSCVKVSIAAGGGDARPAELFVTILFVVVGTPLLH
jgi:hypothetical protein